jgi:hypothetical protein
MHHSEVRSDRVMRIALQVCTDKPYGCNLLMQPCCLQEKGAEMCARRGLEGMLKGQTGIVETWVGSVPVLTVCPRDGALGKSYSAARLQWPLIITGRDKILLV